MWYLLKLEWMKVRKYRPFQIMAIGYLILLPTLFLILRGMDLPDEIRGVAFGTVYMFPTVWTTLGFVGNWLTFFLFGFLAIITFTNEVSYKTMRQNVITGMTQSAFLSSKLVMILAISFCATVYYALVALIFGYIHTDYIIVSKIYEHIDYIPRFFLQSVGYMIFALFFGVVFRRTGLALFIYFTYTFFLETILRYAVHKAWWKENVIMRFYPINAMEDLVPVPLVSERLSEVADEFGFLTVTQAVVSTLVYITVFTAISYWLVRKRDL